MCSNCSLLLTKHPLCLDMQRKRRYQYLSSKFELIMNRKLEHTTIELNNDIGIVLSQDVLVIEKNLELAVPLEAMTFR